MTGKCLISDSAGFHEGPEKCLAAVTALEVLHKSEVNSKLCGYMLLPTVFCERGECLSKDSIMSLLSGIANIMVFRQGALV